MHEEAAIKINGIEINLDAPIQQTPGKDADDGKKQEDYYNYNYDAYADYGQEYAQDGNQNNQQYNDYGYEYDAQNQGAYDKQDVAPPRQNYLD